MKWAGRKTGGCISRRGETGRCRLWASRGKVEETEQDCLWCRADAEGRRVIRRKMYFVGGSFQFHHVFCHVSIAETGAWSLLPSRGYSYSSLAPDDFTQNARWMASLITGLILFAAHHSAIPKWGAQPTHVYVCTLEDGNITPLLVLTTHARVCVCVCVHYGLGIVSLIHFTSLGTNGCWTHVQIGSKATTGSKMTPWLAMTTLGNLKREAKVSG